PRELAAGRRPLRSRRSRGSAPRPAPGGLRLLRRLGRGDACRAAPAVRTFAHRAVLSRLPRPRERGIDSGFRGGGLGLLARGGVRCGVAALGRLALLAAAPRDRGGGGVDPRARRPSAPTARPPWPFRRRSGRVVVVGERAFGDERRLDG